MMSCPDNTITAVLHPDIIHTQILTRLDGPTLASTSCASTHLKHLITNHDHHLWRNISISTWPSISHPTLQSLISSFPNKHRSLYSDSFPQLITTRHLLLDPTRTLTRIVDLVSAIDLFYKGKPVFTRVLETHCDSCWFRSSPFRIDLLESKESVSVPIGSEDAFINDLDKNLTLSWILIDPAMTKSVNMSSSTPVLVRRRWSSGDFLAQFATVLRVDGETEVLCRISVVCGEKEGAMDVKELSMHLEDMDGKNLCGEYSMKVLSAALEFGERRLVGKEVVKERYEAYMERRRERRAERDRRERLLDLVFIGVSICVFVSFWSFIRLWYSLCPDFFFPFGFWHEF